MKNVIIQMLYTIMTKVYYLYGWLRASWFGIKVDPRAHISPYAKIKGVISLGNVEIGRDVEIGYGSYVGSGIIQSAQIGRYCSIAPGVFIGLSEHKTDFWTTSPYEALAYGEPAGITDKIVPKPIIGNSVWIGANVVILRGVTVGDRAIIAAGAVVISDIPNGEMWGGIPAKRLNH